MPSRTPLPRELQQHPFTSSDALARGIPKRRLRSPDVQHPFRGVNVAGADPLAIDALAWALRAKLPGYAYFCGPTAAVLMGIPLPWRLERSRILHVAVPKPRRTPVGAGLRGHTYLPCRVRDWHGIPVAPPEQVWCQLAPLLRLEELVAAGDHLIHHRLPLTSITTLHREVDARPRRGLRIMRAALSLLDDHAESPRESHLRVALSLAGITGFVTNLWITTVEGHRYRADIAFPRQKVILEYQSDYHLDPGQFRRDLTRISRLQADGWLVVQLGADDLENPAELARRVGRILASR